MITLEDSDPSIVESLVGLLLDDGIEPEVAIPSLVDAIRTIADSTRQPTALMDAAIDLLIDRNG